MKRILLFGANGRTGRLIVNYALEKGYAVTALVRSPEKLQIQSEHLTVISGSPTSADDVKKAMRGCHIVISALSALSEKEIFSFKKVRPQHTLERAMRNAVESMANTGINRIITLSSIGVGDSYPLAPWYMRLMIRISNFKIVFADHNRQEELLKRSGLEWTIARPVALNNNDVLKKRCITYDKTPSPFSISRKQLAKFMIDCIDDQQFIKKAPLLSEHT